MTADSSPTSSEEESAWYEGLRGGPARGPAGELGRLWREQLRADAHANAAPNATPRPWAELKAEHDTRQRASVGTSTNVSGARPAANDAWWRWGRYLAPAAVVAIAFALPAWQHGEELTPRGGGSMPGKAMTQRLRHVEPAMAAKELTAKLRSSGAEVSLSEVGGKVHLRVKVSSEHLDAVSATLAAMELSIDGQGEADIQIEAGPP